MIQRRRNQVPPAERLCSPIFAKTEPDPHLEETLRNLRSLGDIQIDPVELLQPLRTAGGLCIKSQSGNYSFERTMYASATPWKKTTPRPSSGSRIALLRSFELRSSRTTKWAPPVFEKSPRRREARAEPGRRFGAYTSPFIRPRQTDIVPLSASFFSGSTETELAGRKRPEADPLRS